MIKNRFKLDLKDKKILFELDQNSRQTASQIAKKIKISTDAVNYRIKRLEENNIITQYMLVVDLKKLGIFQFKICLKFRHFNSEFENNLINKLKLNPKVKWIVSCQGSWDMLISCETESLEEIDNLKDKILILCKDYILDKAISILIEAVTYKRNFLLEKQLDTKPLLIMGRTEKLKINEIDFKILKKLSENARLPIIKIARDLKLSTRIVQYRIKNLEKLNIIVGYKIAINYEKLGLHFYKTFIYLDNPKKERIKALINFFTYHKNIIHHVKVLSNWDLEPEFECYSRKEFDDILLKIKNDFSDIIKSIDIITISKEHKFVYF